MGQGTQQEASRADLPASQCDMEQFAHLQVAKDVEEFSDNQEETVPADHTGCQRDGGEMKRDKKI